MSDREIHTQEHQRAGDQSELQRLLQRMVLEAIFDRGLASSQEIVRTIGEHRALLFVPDADQRIADQIDRALRDGLIEDGGTGGTRLWGLSEAGLLRLGAEA